MKIKVRMITCLPFINLDSKYLEKSFDYFLGIFLLLMHILINKTVSKLQSKIKKRLKNIKIRIYLIIYEEGV